MNAPSRTKGWGVTLAALFLMTHAGLAEAQRRGGGGGGRGGGISRQGPAAGGGFSQRSRSPNAAPSHRGTSTSPTNRPQSTPAPAGQRPEVRPQDPQLGQGGSADQQGNRYEERTERQGTRQEERTERQENRQEAYDDIDVYYPPYGGYHYDDDWDNWDVAVGVVVGGVVGAAVASDDDDDDDDDDDSDSSSFGSNASLPCNPAVTQVKGVTYYQCGDTYYVQAYGGDGPLYVPVPPPG
jgi:hypothetical protein